MAKFTVVLMRPDYLTDEFGQDCYVALVEASNEYAAVQEGQNQVAASDEAEVDEGLRDGCTPNPDDYYPLLVFEGHIEVKLFGFQL